MLFRFVYLDRPTLAGYVSQLDGGLIAETNVSLVKKKSVGGHIKVNVVGVKAEGAKDENYTWSMTFPPEAQFQRLLAAAYDTPDDVGWIDIVEPDANFQSAQVGETIAWECDVDITHASRMAARGGGGANLLEIMGLAAAAGGSGIKMGKTPIQPSQASTIQKQVDATRQVLDKMNVRRVAVGRDTTTKWTVFGELNPDHFQAEDIDNERLIIVGKIKRIILFGESRKLVNTVAMQLMEFFSKDKQTESTGYPDNEIFGPALELDILSIHR